MISDSLVRAFRFIAGQFGGNCSGSVESTATVARVDSEENKWHHVAGVVRYGGHFSALVIHLVAMCVCTFYMSSYNLSCRTDFF